MRRVLALLLLSGCSHWQRWREDSRLDDTPIIDVRALASSGPAQALPLVGSTRRLRGHVTRIGVTQLATGTSLSERNNVQCATIEELPEERRCAPRNGRQRAYVVLDEALACVFADEESGAVRALAAGQTADLIGTLAWVDEIRAGAFFTAFRCRVNQNK